MQKELSPRSFAPFELPVLRFACMRSVRLAPRGPLFGGSRYSPLSIAECSLYPVEGRSGSAVLYKRRSCTSLHADLAAPRLEAVYPGRQPG